jgi:hypothetical protein
MLFRSFVIASLLFAGLLVMPGCGDSNPTVTPEKVEPVPANAPVEEPPSSDEM